MAVPVAVAVRVRVAEVCVGVGDAVDWGVGDDARVNWGVAVLVDMFMGVSNAPEDCSDVPPVRVTMMGRGDAVGISSGFWPLIDRIHTPAATTTRAPAAIAVQVRRLETGGLPDVGVTGSGVSCGRMSTMVASSWRTSVLGDCIARRAA